MDANNDEKCIFCVQSGQMFVNFKESKFVPNFSTLKISANFVILYHHQSILATSTSLLHDTIAVPEDLWLNLCQANRPHFHSLPSQEDVLQSKCWKFIFTAKIHFESL